MSDFENYKDLRKAVKAVSDLYCPAPEVLAYFSVKPYKTKETGISKFIKNNSMLPKEEVVSLMQFMELIREDFFKVLTVTESNNSREFLLEKRTRATPYYLEKGQMKLAEKIEEAFGEHFKLLPIKLYQSNRLK